MLSTLSRQAARCFVFSYDEIKQATNNFHYSNIIGSGGEGDVYKGKLSDGQHVAVKCLRPHSREFEKEIDMLFNLHHANLVSLIGYCDQQHSKILVNEFMVNRSLHDNIYKTGGCSLSWEDRLKICIGAARGLDYLHTGTSADSKIIHRDMKPANILLDENFVPKILDFGLSRKGPATRSGVITDSRGTPGYIPPEYINNRLSITRGDVYAFGMILFHVLCGKSSWEYDNSNVTDPSRRLWTYGNIDEFLQGAISTSCLEAFISTAEKCANKDPFQRPTMSEVVSRLVVARPLQSSTSKTTYTRREPKEVNRPYKYLPTILESRIQKDIASDVKTTKLKNTPSNQTNAGSSMTLSRRRTLSDIPGIERKVVLYSSLQTHTDCHKIRLYLNVYKMVIEERDPTRDERYEAELRHFFSRTGRRYSLPQ